MPRDYKNTKNTKSNPKPLTGQLLSLLTGLTVGLFIAFLVYLHEHTPIRDAEVKATTATDQPIPKQAETKESVAKEPQLPEPTFDFYKILPDREVNISEWIAESQDKEKQQPDASDIYIFQVGSFKDYPAADQVKARLALIGITAEIQRVVINGQDTRHRVRVGPYNEPDKISEIRERLMANNMEFMLLKLKLEDI
jgi:cell division protein FtsN